MRWKVCLQFSFNIKFDDWRDRTFIKSGKNEITSVRFIYPADSSFSLTKKDSIWYSDGLKTDSLATADFLNSMILVHGQDFMDGFKPDLNPVIQMVVEGNNLLNFSIKCYEGSNAGEYILNSSLNPDVYFASKKNGLFSQLFKPRSYFLKNGRKK